VESTFSFWSIESLIWKFFQQAFTGYGKERFPKKRRMLFILGLEKINIPFSEKFLKLK